MATILVLHGPNLAQLGTREPTLYGHASLTEINQQLMSLADQLDHELICKQSNAEHQLIEWIHYFSDKAALLLFNPAAFTHTSIALRDAVLTAKLPLIEVHLSNPHARESFRHQSYFSDIALGVIAGFGIKSYLLALQAGDHYLKSILSSA